MTSMINSLLILVLLFYITQDSRVFCFEAYTHFVTVRFFPPTSTYPCFSLSPRVCLRWWLSAPRMRCWALANSKTHLGVSSHLMNDPVAGGRIDTKSVCLCGHAFVHVGGVRCAGAFCWAGNPIKSWLPHTHTRTNTKTLALTHYILL